MRCVVALWAAVFVITLAPAFAATSGPAVTMKTSNGTVLATQQGMTLYSFSRDARDKSNCIGKCAANWPPFLASANAKQVGAWSLVRRPDGKRQWAYHGAPLYTWSKDKKPGETNGNGLLHGAWKVARPAPKSAAK